MLAVDERQAHEKVQAIGFRQFRLRRSRMEILTSCVSGLSRGVSGLMKRAVLTVLLAGFIASAFFLISQYMAAQEGPVYSIRRSDVAGKQGKSNGLSSLRVGTHRYRDESTGEINIISCSRCRECHETGITVCMQCGGFGALERAGTSTCKRCKGRGLVSANFRVWNPYGGQRRHETTCPDCRGDGRVKTSGLNLSCPVCEGVGRQQCAACSGHGIIVTNLERERWLDRFQKFVKSLYERLNPTT